MGSWNLHLSCARGICTCHGVGHTWHFTHDATPHIHAVALLMSPCARVQVCRLSDAHRVFSSMWYIEGLAMRLGGYVEIELRIKDWPLTTTKLERIQKFHRMQERRMGRSFTYVRQSADELTLDLLLKAPALTTTRRNLYSDRTALVYAYSAVDDYIDLLYNELGVREAHLQYAPRAS